MSRCPNCDKAIKHKAKFCRHCGLKIPQDDFDFGNSDNDALSIDAELIAEIISMPEDERASYDIDLVSNVVDLHISESSLEFGTPVLQVQMEIAEKSIDSCIASGHDRLEFISGKGNFVLYERLTELLEKHPQIGRIEKLDARIVAYFKTL